jgi:P-type Mg2+ transporter
MIILPITCAIVGAVLPFSPLAHTLGFSRLPVAFFLILVGMILTYLMLVEIAKARFYGTVAHPRKPPSTHQQRLAWRIARRAARFTHHTAMGVSI